ncbi:SDR family NAD(P)-dependent oxidoreductase [Nocardioides sp. BP30]|uniref:SDR family NAD(P)-dependent oxidoreductase n=1 Tax=Nocardioides sp. BP30 TaxID=3036374 RepID=UPI002468525D|nr:SDR family NAD(P)-dependent oxidoreductase [Nocardioides sp. BP30]WGL53018.1 SDR family NAD(P)-dependent oxidoreductase [Nocardioides sp. BP30]
MQVRGATALVTGASAGIGAAVAGLLAERGAAVLVHGRDAGRTAAVADGIGGRPIVADLATAEGVDALAAAAEAVDVLVLNAGAGHAGPFVEMPADRIEELLALDLTGAIRLTRVLLPGMLARGRGRLCFVSSIAGRTGVAGEAVYAAAKAGLDAFAESLRLELAGSGVGVSVVVPAVVDTGFFESRGRPYDRRSPRPLPARAVAAAILSAVERDRAEVFVPGWTRLAPTVRALAPAAFRRLSLRYGEEVRSR